MAARFTLDQRRTQVDRDAGTVQLYRIGKVRFRVTQPLIGRLRSVTVSRDSAGRWFAAFTADGVPLATPVPAQHTALGVDLGLKDTAALSTGQIVQAPKYLAAKQAKLRRYQRSYSRQRDAALTRMGINPNKRIPKGTRIPVSGRMRRRKMQIGTLHARIANARCNHQHQLTTRVVNAANVIAIEDLNVKAMSRSMRRPFRRSVSDAGLGEIRRQMTYKTIWHGRHLSVVDRFFPSSQLCSTDGCDYRHRNLQLHERQWQCPQCHTKHHRDSNAAKNIENDGLRLLAQTGPDGHTPRAKGTNARGEGTCATDKASSVGQPTSLNRELIYRAAKLRPTRTCQNGLASRVEG